VPKGAGLKNFRGFALMARRDIFSIGDCASPNPNAKGHGSLESILSSSVFT
jgi:hypothetical protein